VAVPSLFLHKKTATYLHVSDQVGDLGDTENTRFSSGSVEFAFFRSAKDCMQAKKILFIR
jgi:hypothetical protein